jgi:hypothetical protein
MSNSSILSNRGLIQIHIAGRHVGDVENGVFKKSISASRHFLRKPPAIALSVEALQEANQAGARDIQITDLESGQIYACTFEHFMTYSFPLQRGGFEPQRALVLEQFDVSSPLAITSQAPKPGEVKRRPGNRKRIQYPPGRQTLTPRQMILEGIW